MSSEICSGIGRGIIIIIIIIIMVFKIIAQTNEVECTFAQVNLLLISLCLQF